MAQIECGRGHLYDPEKNPTCPYCNGGQKITVASAGRTAPIGRSVLSSSRTAPVGGTPVTAAQKTAPLSGVSVTAPQKTAPLSGISVTAPQKTMPPRGYGVPAPEPVQTAPPPPPGMGVSVAAAGKTVGMMQSQMGFDPVVGWPACVAGPSRGKSYTVRGGVNSIGRSERMDIVITGDLKISAENHAKISYSDKHNRFNLLPSEGRNIVYLNDEEVFTPMPLHAYDLIDFGETKLLFVPLCGEKFTWEDKDGTV